jgi:transcriptional regulator with XRE-family HTH domain
VVSEKDQGDLQKALAAWLAKLRTEKGLSQESLATQLGKGQSDIAKIESGKKKITVVELLAWLDALDVPIERINEGLDPLFKKISVKKSLWKK